MGFLRTVLIIICAYYILKWVGRLVGPWLMKKAAQKMQAQAQSQYQGQRDGRPEGDIRVEIDPSKSQRASKSSTPATDGDYIDFEEITD